MDYFTSETKPTDTITDKINVYANKISLKKLFKRDENGNEQEVDLNNEVPPASTDTVNLATSLKPEFWTFLPYYETGQTNTLNAMLNDLCASRTKSMINVDGREYDIHPWVICNTSWESLQCVYNTFSYRSREPGVMANKYRIKFYPNDNWTFFLYTENVATLRTLRLEVSGKIYIQNTSDVDNYLEFRFKNNQIMDLTEHCWPLVQFIKINKNSNGGQAQFYDFYFSYIVKYPTIVGNTSQKIFFERRLKPIVGYVENSISYKIVNMSVFCEPFAIGTGE